jgi:hypothetical protein
MWNIDPNQTQALLHIQNMYPKVGLVEEAKGGGKRRKEK